MKKITMILAVSAALLSGCVKENISINNTSAGDNKGEGIRTIRVGVGDQNGVQSGDQTRMGVNIDRDAKLDTYYWKAGDAVYLCQVATGDFTGKNFRFELDAASIGSASGTFTLTAGEEAPTAGNYLVLHLRNEADITLPTADPGSHILYKLPVSQQQINGAEDVADYMLMASPEPVALAVGGAIPSVTLAHKTAVIELAITASDPALDGAALTGVSMAAGTADQYAGMIELSTTSDATPAAGRVGNTLTVDDPAATLGDKPYYVRMVTMMNAAAAGSVTFTFTARNDSGTAYVSQATLPSIDLNTGYVRPVTFDLASHAIPIYTADDLNNVRNKLAESYILMNDISLADYSSGEGWAPIGTDNTTPFTGKFNGNGRRITGLTINRPTEDCVGLFGHVTGSSITDLGVEITTGGVNGLRYSGGIVGMMGNGAITSCYSTGNISSTNLSGTLTVTGGIAGSAQFCTITDCYSTGNVNASSEYGYSGGIVGSPLFAIITNCYSTGDISTSTTSTTTSSVSGGIAADVQDCTITDCYSTGNISSSAYAALVGGIAGSTRSSTIINCYSTGNISSSSSVAADFFYNAVGGIVGRVYVYGDAITIINCAAINPTINSSNGAGRIVGYIRFVSGTLTISNNFASEDMSDPGMGKFDTANPMLYGVTKTDAQLKAQTTYSGAINGDGLGGLGWTFGSTDDAPWKMPAGGTGYPIFYWQ